jgi:pimeloyl-ACP methyl ester carboxylesterase
VGTEKNVCLARLGALFIKADAYDPLTLEIEVLEHQQELHQSVWKEAKELRSSGRLLDLGKQIQCPVVAIHGDYDPHPAQDVQEPLSAVVGRFRFILLKNFGHLPWIERQARDSFYATLKGELD